MARRRFQLHPPEFIYAANRIFRLIFAIKDKPVENVGITPRMESRVPLRWLPISWWRYHPGEIVTESSS